MLLTGYVRLGSSHNSRKLVPGSGWECHVDISRYK